MRSTYLCLVEYNSRETLHSIYTNFFIFNRIIFILYLFFFNIKHFITYIEIT